MQIRKNFLELFVKSHNYSFLQLKCKDELVVKLKVSQILYKSTLLFILLN